MRRSRVEAPKKPVPTAPTSALARIDRQHPDVQQLVQASSPVLAQANRLIVKNEKTKLEAGLMLTDVKRRITAAEALRKRFVDPLKQHVRDIDNLFKELSAPLHQADAQLREKLLTYQHEEEERKREAQERAAALQAQAEAAKSRKKRERLAEEVIDARIEVVNAAPVAVAGIATVERWDFEVVDAMKVPREYLLVDDGEIREAVRNGVRKIPGVRIFTTKGLAVRG